MATLWIDSWSSTCSACGKGADPNEKAHITRLDYGDHDGKGCGEEFSAVASSMWYGEETVREMRPDLPYAGTETRFTAPELLEGLNKKS